MPCMSRGKIGIMSKATPKSLVGAIENALADLPPMVVDRQAKQIRLHVKDFLSQKFGAVMLLHPSLENALSELFESCTGGGS